jgi:hypothetical protein
MDKTARNALLLIALAFGLLTGGVSFFGYGYKSAGLVLGFVGVWLFHGLFWRGR